MNLRQLRYFTTIARLGSFTAAARILNVSQPALGYQLKALEEEMGVVLLHRHSRGVRMTDAGRVLFDSGMEALDAFAEAERSLAAFGGPTGRLLLGVAPTPGRALLPELLPLAASSGAGLQIVVRQGMSDELRESLLQGELGAVLCYDLPHLPQMSVMPLYRENLYLVGQPAALEGVGDPLSFDRLAEFPLVLDGQVRRVRRLIDEVAAARHMRLDLIEVEPANVKREIIMHHGRCTIVPYGLFIDEIREGRVAARQIAGPVLERIVALGVHPDLPIKTATLLEALVQPIVARIIEEGELRWSAVGTLSDRTDKSKNIP
jgi:LysR family nitrogen assimilation transcriptional regulator